MISRRHLFALASGFGAILISAFKAKAVTQDQVAAAIPLYEGIAAANAAIAQLASANGVSSILGFTVTVGDSNMNGTGQIIVNIPLNPANAAPLFTSMQQQLQSLATAMTTQMSGL